MIKSEVVPLAVSAHGKFNEAAYFFNRMLETHTNVRLLPHHLSAFLSALRSATFHLQAQFNKDQHFNSWYAQKQEEMRQDPLLRMLKDFRDEELHEHPVNLTLLHGPRIPSSGIKTNHLEFSSTIDDAGEIRVSLKVGRDGPERAVPSDVRWVVELPDEIDIVDACRRGLERMDALLREWDDLRQRVTLEHTSGHSSEHD